MYPLDRRTVRGSIPSQAGVYEIYVDTGDRTPGLLGRAKAYYGGLRNTLRGLIDRDTPYPLNGVLLDLNRAHYARFALCESPEDMDDVLFFFAGRDEYQDRGADDSGRYEWIYLNEDSVVDPIRR